MEAPPPISLDALFRPRSVAVIGASRRRGTIGGELFHNLVARDFAGAIYAVNRKADVVQTERAYASVCDIPDPVDLAVLVVPHDEVLGVVDQCARKGVKALVVIGAGFAETGSAGEALQRDLAERVRAAGMRMVGPNCLGLLSTEPGRELNATFAPAWPPAGNVAVSSQSGALGLAVLDYARALGIGISQFVSVGNRADVSSNDLLEHWEADPRTRVILLYLESFGNPRRFLEIASRVSRSKPIVAVKSGRSTAGSRAAGSHTGALATPDVTVDAILREAGVIRTDTIEELFDVAALLANQSIPAGNRVAIVTNAGGPGIMAADACEAHGLTLPAPGADTVAALARALPPEAALRNPIDMIASASPAQFEEAVRRVLADGAFDAVLVLYVPPLVTKPTEVAAAIRRAVQGAEKPVAVCLLGHDDVSEARELLRAARVPVYPFPENAVMALGRAAEHGRWLRRPQGRSLDLWADEAARAREAAAPLLAPAATATGPRWLDARSVRAVLAAYGIEMPACRVVTTEDEAVAAAEELGWPVALKITSRTIAHKTDVGGVALGLKSPWDLRAAHRVMLERLTRDGHVGEVSGFLVEKMIEAPRGAGVETLVGLTRVPELGDLVAFGLGGVQAELMRDVVFRVGPVTDVEAREMMAALRGGALLTGFRGSAGVDRDALERALLRVSRLGADFPAIVSLDINPLLALPPGQGVLALDARIQVEG
ncbi:MAG TPA: acetate--CoA ligase family protein [Polyangia bacterium]|nr:acetate--CoA ligase family protein [Polyangia bacterium]